MKKLIISLMLLCFFSLLYSKEGQYSRILYERHTNIYDLIYFINITEGHSLLSNKRPQSVAQLALELEDLDVEKMDILSLAIYETIKKKLYPRYLLNYEYIKFDTNLKLALQFKALHGEEYAPYVDQFNTYNDTPAPITVPFNILISDYAYFYIDLVLQKNFAATKLSHTYINVPFFQRDLDFHFPTRVGVSFGGTFFNVHVGRGPFNVGRSLSGSQLIADTADRLDYLNASIFVKNFNLDMNIFQLQHSRFVFMHELSFRLFKKLSITVHEGLLVNSYFDPRYLNPFMIMHNHAPWYDPWQREDKLEYQDDVYTSCQLGITLDVVLCRGLRLYAQYGQNQLQTPSELKGGAGFIPNGMGGLCGIEWVQGIKAGYLIATLEGVYALPWYYIGKNKWVSFTHWRRENVSSLREYKNSTINIWLANPYGPDTIAFFARLGYVSPDMWGVDFLYRLVVKGENEANFFDKSKELYPDIYYPFSDRASLIYKDWALWMSPTGNPIYFNTLKCAFSYNILSNLVLKGYLSWSIASRKIYGHNIDGSISLEYGIKNY